MKVEKTCDNCTNKYLCPNFNKCGACMGWGEREVFIGFVKLLFGMVLPPSFIEERFDHIKQIQEEK